MNRWKMSKYLLLYIIDLMSKRGPQIEKEKLRKAVYSIQEILVKHGHPPDYKFEIYPENSPRSEILLLNLDLLHGCGFIGGEQVFGPIYITNKGKDFLRKVMEKLKETYGQETLEEIRRYLE